MSNPKPLIKTKDINTIQSYGLDEFNKTHSFAGLSPGETQAYLILRGLEHFLSSKGIECPFLLEERKKDK